MSTLGIITPLFWYSTQARYSKVQIKYISEKFRLLHISLLVCHRTHVCLAWHNCFISLCTERCLYTEWLFVHVLSGCLFIVQEEQSKHQEMMSEMQTMHAHETQLLKERLGKFENFARQQQMDRDCSHEELLAVRLQLAEQVTRNDEIWQRLQPAQVKPTRKDALVTETNIEQQASILVQVSVCTGLPWLLVSDYVLNEMSVRSPGKLFIFVIQNNIYRLKVFQTRCF